MPLKYSNLINYSLFINTICQLKCPYCYSRKIKKWNQILSFHDICYIVNHLKKSRDFSITILGGEPTLHKDLNKILSLLIQLDNCKVIEIFTNGLKLVNLPKSNKIKIFISYHNHDIKNAYYHYQNYNCTICVPDYEDTDEIMKFIYENNIKFHIQYIINEKINDPKLISYNDTDKFLYKDKVITLDYVIKNQINFKKCLCEQRYFLLEKDHILDECNHKTYKYNEIEKIELTRVCDFENCFKNGDFLLYNKKFKV